MGYIRVILTFFLFTLTIEIPFTILTWLWNKFWELQMQKLIRELQTISV